MGEEVEAKVVTDMAENGRDPETGRFLPGWKGGPGRPRGCVDFMQVMRKKAREHNMDVEEMIWEVGFSMFNAAKGGDVQAAKMILERFCGMQERGGNLEVNVDARQVSIGPPAPEGQDMGDFIKQLADVAAKNGMMRETEEVDDE
jgi:hypothetical protein